MPFYLFNLRLSISDLDGLFKNSDFILTRYACWHSLLGCGVYVGLGQISILYNIIFIIIINYNTPDKRRKHPSVVGRHLLQVQHTPSHRRRREHARGVWRPVLNTDPSHSSRPTDTPKNTQTKTETRPNVQTHVYTETHVHTYIYMHTDRYRQNRYMHTPSYSDT